MSTVSRYWKCIVSFVAPGCVLLVTGATDGLDRNELVIAALTCVVTAGAVYSAPNATAETAAEPSDM